MNFCVTDGESVVASRYISSRKDEAASLVVHLASFMARLLHVLMIVAVVFFWNDL